MPQPGLHLALADDSLLRWLQQPSAAPFDLQSVESRTAFLLGALAPDMGFFPGGSAARPLSHAVHAGGAIIVARLLVGSRCEHVRAFGLGWTSHALADVRIHPLVNLAGAALLHDEGERDPGEDLRLVAHVRVELGLEACFARKRRTTTGSLNRALERALLGTLHGAAAILNVPLDPSQLLAAYRAVIACLPFCEHLASALAADLRRGPTRVTSHDFLRLAGVRRAASLLIPRTSALFGFLNPVRPAPWLMQRVGAEVKGFAAFLDEVLADGLDDVPDFDLNTGAWTDAAGRATAA